MIEQGKVKVNGHVAKLGDKVSPRDDVVTLSGRRIQREKGGRIYLMLHKPRGFVTTMNDEMGRRCVADLLDDVPARFIQSAVLIGNRKDCCCAPTTGILPIV